VFTGAGKSHTKKLLKRVFIMHIEKNMTFIMSIYDFCHVFFASLVISLFRIQEVRATLGSAPGRLSVTGNRSLNDTCTSLVSWWSASRLLFLNDFWFSSFKPPCVARSFIY
jgi:hypothetical protein